MKNICLVVVYNHKYEKNIPLIENVYKGRFSHIYHLIPFSNVEKENVIPVYSSSFHFEGSIAQGYRSYSKDEYSHYVFAADDLLLNPRLNENNIIDELNLSSERGYIKSLAPLSSIYFLWVYLTKVYEAFSDNGVEYLRELPSKDAALEKMSNLGIDYSKKFFAFNSLKHWNGRYKFSDFIKYKGFWKKALHLFGKRLELPYPLLAGYSDFVIVPTNAIKKFSHYCGVFSSMGLFAEVAIPTALALSCNEIVSELTLGANWVTGTMNSNSYWKGKEIWNTDEVNDLEKKNNNKLTNLLNDFSDNLLYIHPIKLSRWN